ncbi:ArsA family ATPase [Clostridium grantii]|uniref:arsenite-transporting ATPase n=1 Tax=Clostridium grantii DSM 8605 TaxID=1121316 RepID=A0A1M5VMG9_9CLOT|nr:ArsA family ATPase [Clostridium grantii]SHH76400.1 arsenite-transporting ATPase [Clostridium grantii DSM 8605]
MRIILYTGKGGVGKTSVAAATACKIEKDGKKVLIMSTDQAHSLSDAFDKKLGNTPTKIHGKLDALEIDTISENENMWGNIKGYFEKIMLLKSEKSIETEEVLIFPGFEDLLALLKIKEFYDQGYYDVLIVDCAPTGETMSILKFPELFKWWMVKFFPMKKKAAKTFKPLVEKTMKVPMPDDEMFDEIELLYNKIDELHKLMLQKDIVSLRIVTTPERIVIKEAKRNFTYLHLYDFNVDAIIINRIMSQEGGKGYFEKWMNIQMENIRDIYQSFKPVPIFKSELRSTEVRKYDTLLEMGESIFKTTRAEKVLFEEKVFELEKSKEDESYYLKISMPFVDKRELNLYQKGDELSISIKNEKRNFTLPKKLQSKEIIKASYIDDKFVIQFM